MEIRTFESLEEMDQFHQHRRHQMEPLERLKIYGQLNNVSEAINNPYKETGIPVRFNDEDKVYYL
ncbi:MAG: hypothetical protein ABEJ65_07955 [bacterium]